MSAEIIRIYGNGWCGADNIPPEIITSRSIVIVDEYTVLENITKEDGVDIIYIQVEPKIIYDQTMQIIRNAHKCAKIYTYDDDVLGNCQNAKKYVFGTTWIPRDYYNNIDTSRKQFKTSVLVGSKNINNARGHLFRREIYNQQSRFIDNDLKVDLFISSNQPPTLPLREGNRPLLDSKIPLFENYQFSIIIENERQPNYFSEKLMDCLITKTIPVYFGCHNIFQYFDISYWIVLNSIDVDTLHDRLNEIPLNFYEQNREKIEDNYRKCLPYVSLNGNLRNALPSHNERKG